MPGPATCRIPVKATVRITGGVATVIPTEYAEIDASRIAELLINGFGADAIPTQTPANG
jgi:hypothetical protein